MAKVKLERLNIDSISYSSSVTSGHNTQIKWSHKSKKVEGFGLINGKNNHVSHNYIKIKGSNKETE